MQLPEPAMATREEIEANVKTWRQKNRARLDADKAARKLKEEEDILFQWLVQTFVEQELEGVMVDGRITGVTRSKRWIVEDKAKLVAYIKQTGSLDLLQFRLSEEAVKDRANNGVEVPGCVQIDLEKLFDRQA